MPTTKVDAFVAVQKRPWGNVGQTLAPSDYCLFAFAAKNQANDWGARPGTRLLTLTPGCPSCGWLSPRLAQPITVNVKAGLATPKCCEGR